MSKMTITNKNSELEEIKNLNDIDTDTKEGKLVMALLANITSEYQMDKEPDEVLLSNVELAREMFKKEATANEFYVSFGMGDQQFFQGGHTVVIAKDMGEARRKTFNAYGPKFFTVYTKEDWDSHGDHGFNVICRETI